MRNRTTLILLFAIALAIVPLVQMNQSETRCEVRNGVADDSGFVGLFGFNDSDNTNPCADTAQTVPSWGRGLGFVSIACFGACIYSGLKTRRERREEEEMFRTAGIGRNRGKGRRT